MAIGSLDRGSAVAANEKQAIVSRIRMLAKHIGVLAFDACDKSMGHKLLERAVNRHRGHSVA